MEVLEKRVAALEGGSAAVACASGQSAVFQAIFCLAHAGDNIISSINLYGGSYSLFNTILPRMGITVQWVSGDDPESYRGLINERTKLVFVETIGNPRISIPDLRVIADIAHDAGVPFVVRNMPTSPQDHILTYLSLPRLTTPSVPVDTGAPSSSMALILLSTPQPSGWAGMAQPLVV